MVFFMFEFQKTPESEQLMAMTKSDSNISGVLLAKTHMRLGELLAQQLTYPPKETTVIAIMRGGIFFAQGIYFGLGCQFDIYEPKSQNFKKPETKHCILVDSVINKGKTIAPILEPYMDIACCVANENAVKTFGNQLYPLRISKNSFIGSNIKKQEGNRGPDTTMRLFNQL